MEKISVQNNKQEVKDVAKSTSSMGDIYTENGVYMTSLQHEGQNYALGSTTPRFLHELTSMPMQPSLEDFEALRQKGLWLEPMRNQSMGEHHVKVAVTCGGVGSAWPGMGRALYDTFPAARAAMDRLAAVAQWDILSLMDEKDMEKVGQTRWQLSYLFFLEYAQASYLQSLGFAPYLMSGHSLGEIISLCLAGFYSPEIAWQIIDRRAVYVDGLERDAKDGMGMMAVYGSYDKVQKILELFPELHICNHNTPTQFMLGGKKEMLAEARRILRKDKCPALTLPINMAFHHPHLRVLRQSAIDGLMGLPILEPKIPVLSNVTAGFYPTHKEGVAQYIADLDENTVRWVDCVRHMWDDLQVRHFVELGSADNISGLTREIEPQAVCIPVSLKNAEVQSMRAAVAHLYALGHIPTCGLHVVPKASMMSAEQTHATGDDSSSPPMAAHVQEILPLMAEAAGVEVAVLRAHMDLRHDLALRSNRFPSIMLKVEQLYGIRLHLEDVLHVATIQDFADVVARLRSLDIESPSQSVTKEKSAASETVAKEKTLPPLLCMCEKFSQEGAKPHWQIIPWPSSMQDSPSDKPHVVLYAGTANTALANEKDDVGLFAALEGLARGGAHIIFYVPPLASAKRPSASLLAQWQTMGARVEVQDDVKKMQDMSLHSFIHLIEGDLLQELASPTDIPLLRTLEQGRFTVDSVLTLVSGVHKEQETAFDVEPALETVLGFWRDLAERNSQAMPRLRTVQIPPVVHMQGTLPHESRGIHLQELALYFMRWFWCASVAQGRWVRSHEVENVADNVTLQENLSSYPQLLPLHYAVQKQGENYREIFSAQQHFSAYATQLEWRSAQVSRAPQLSFGQLLQTLYHGVHVAWPWLHCVGMDSIAVMPDAQSAVLQGPEGVTREGRLTLQSGNWSDVNTAPLTPYTATLCPVELALRDVSVNGRRLDVWKKAVSGQALTLTQAKLMTPIEPLWQGADDVYSCVQNISLQRLFAGKTFAKQMPLRYAWVSEFVDILQEAVQGQHAQGTLSWQGIEVLRHLCHEEFMQSIDSTQDISITSQWRIHFKDATTCILDGQVLNAAGKVMLVAKNMSFTL